MKKIDLADLLSKNYPDFVRYPSLVKKILLFFLSKIMHVREINDFIESNSSLKGFDFIEELFEKLDISYTISAKDKLKIPSEGKLLIVSNHPLGGIDGLILIKAVSEVRSDVKIIVNDILMHVENLKEYFIPFDLFNGKPQRDNIQLVYDSIKRNEAIIIFPAAEVSRLKLLKISDSKWKKSVIQLSGKFNAPILPVFIKAKNSILFYLVSIISKRLSLFLLPQEVFNKRGQNIHLKIGHHIPSDVFRHNYYKKDIQIKLLRKHVEQISKDKPGVFQSQKNVIHPIDKKLLKHQLSKSKFLGFTGDRKKIFLAESYLAPDVLKEIARLREISFRKVSEGTGKKMDRDKYDEYYKHLVLWDEDELEIVGSYRIGIGRTIISTLGVNGFYTSELFTHSQQLQNILAQSAELGRSFIQSKYWNTYALDYLWQGLGVFLKDNPYIKYTFGGVSLSKSYSDEAKKHIIFFYKKWFGDKQNLSAAKNRFIISNSESNNLSSFYSSFDYRKDLISLKNYLKHLGFSLPVLYKQYSELSERDGIKFIDFSLDPDFNNCVDALILLEIDKIRQDKKERYFGTNKKLKLNKPEEVLII